MITAIDVNYNEDGFIEHMYGNYKIPTLLLGYSKASTYFL
jgi:hypothetical protein